MEWIDEIDDAHQISIPDHGSESDCIANGKTIRDALVEYVNANPLHSHDQTYLSTLFDYRSICQLSID